MAEELKKDSCVLMDKVTIAGLEIKKINNATYLEQCGYLHTHANQRTANLSYCGDQTPYSFIHISGKKECKYGKQVSFDLFHASNNQVKLSLSVPDDGSATLTA